MGMTLQIVELAVGKDENGDTPWTRIVGTNSRGRVPIKFRGPMALALAARANATLGEGETISGKKLFVEVEGAWESFVNGDGKNIRFYKPTGFEIAQGPSLELARMRSEAVTTVQNAEILRKAGALAQAYKMITEFAAEIAHLPLDLSDLNDADNELIGTIGEEDHNPEAAAAAHYLREERMALAEEKTEQAGPQAPQPVDVDLDEIVLSNDEEVPDLDEAPALGEDTGTTAFEMLDAIRTGARIEAELAAAEEAERLEADEDNALSDGPEPEADGDNEPEADADAENDNEVEEETAAAPARRTFGRSGFGRR